MSISPILFNTFLDAELQRVGLLDFYIQAWADNIVFVADSWVQANCIMNKLDRLGGGLSINLDKSKIMI